MNTRTIAAFIVGIVAASGLMIAAAAALTITATPLDLGTGPIRLVESVVTSDAVTVEFEPAAYLLVIAIGIANAAVARRTPASREMES